MAAITLNGGRRLAATLRRLLAPIACIAAIAAALTSAGCDEAADGRFPIRIGKETFRLEVAATPDKRTLGLGGRDHIEPEGGMVFVFPVLDRTVKEFVMRDCLTDIDIIYVDDSGRVVKWHQMKMEAPRQEGETEAQYESRLKRYSSVFPVRIAIELAPGSIPRLKTQGLREGLKIECDLEALKALAE